MFLVLKKVMPSCAAWGKTSLISTVWDNLKKGVCNITLQMRRAQLQSGLGH